MEHDKKLMQHERNMTGNEPETKRNECNVKGTLYKGRECKMKSDERVHDRQTYMIFVDFRLSTKDTNSH